MQPHPSSEDLCVLDKLVSRIATGDDVHHMLSTIIYCVMAEVEAVFARIWLLAPADQCDTCPKASVCDQREQCLHLAASTGLHTNLQGEHRRIPLGLLKVGMIAQEQKPYSSNHLLDDPHIVNKAWVREYQLRSFGGYPLVFQGELLGVIAVFSRQPMDDSMLDRLEFFANQAAIAVKNVQLFSEVERLKKQLQEENTVLREEIRTAHEESPIIGKHNKVKALLQQVEQVAPTDATVLILGETGTGKELLANRIHQLSSRSDQSLVKINCGAISAGLVESELFGHEKGAFTGALQQRVGRFEIANGGTLFLDEIGDLPLDTQVKLLRVLQEQEFERVGSSTPIRVDVRIIAATHHDLTEKVKAGQFRADLFYRLNIFPLQVPPLRERRSDIPHLIEAFVAKFAQKLNKPLAPPDLQVIEHLSQAPLPGNIRELQNIIERAAILATGDFIAVEHLPHFAAPTSQEASEILPLQAVERAHILHVLQSTQWVIEGKQGAATLLQLHPNTLRSRMKKLDIQRTASHDIS